MKRPEGKFKGKRYKGYFCRLLGSMRVLTAILQIDLLIFDFVIMRRGWQGMLTNNNVINEVSREFRSLDEI